MADMLDETPTIVEFVRPLETGQTIRIITDGTLAFTFPSLLCAKNLHESGKELNFQVPVPNDNNPRLRLCSTPALRFAVPSCLPR